MESNKSGLVEQVQNMLDSDKAVNRRDMLGKLGLFGLLAYVAPTVATITQADAKGGGSGGGGRGGSGGRGSSGRGSSGRGSGGRGDSGRGRGRGRGEGRGRGRGRGRHSRYSSHRRQSVSQCSENIDRRPRTTVCPPPRG